MMLDEAINILKSDNEYNKSIGCDISYEEQLLEWLEELKAIKENSISKEAFEKMKSIAYKKGHKQGYNKALDDFKKILTIEKIKEYAESDGYINLNNCSLMIFDSAERLREQK